MTTTDGLPSPKVVHGHIERLRRRANHLRAQLDAPEPHISEAQRTYIVAELAALEWALPVLEAQRDEVLRLHRLVAEHAHPADATGLQRTVEHAEARQARRLAGAR